MSLKRCKKTPGCNRLPDHAGACAKRLGQSKAKEKSTLTFGERAIADAGLVNTGVDIGARLAEALLPFIKELEQENCDDTGGFLCRVARSAAGQYQYEVRIAKKSR